MPENDTPPAEPTAAPSKDVKTSTSKRSTNVAKTTDDPTYSVVELQGAAARFDTSPAAIAAAMQHAGLEEATLAEAEKAIRDFNEREV